MWRTNASGRWKILAEAAIVPTTVLSASRSSNKPGSTKKETAGRNLSRPGLMVTSPPVSGGQEHPQPVPKVPAVVENLCSLLPGSEDLPVLFSRPIKPEIKVSDLKPALYYLNDGRIFYDKHLPDPEPSFLSRIVPHNRYSSDYFVALHHLVAAPGTSYPAHTYNFKGARIPLAHTKLNILKWR